MQAPNLGLAVIIHSLDHALAALVAAERVGRAITLLSPSGAAGSMGPLLFMSIVAQARTRHPAVPVDAVLDCGDRAGDALAALRQGVPAIRFTGRADVADKLAAIAAQRGQRVLRSELPALDLLHRTDSNTALALWLDGVAKG